MKKISLLLMAFLFVFSIATVAIADDNGEMKEVRVKSKLVGASQLQNTNGIIVIGGKQITPPDISFSYWGAQGVYNVRFYGYPMKSTRAVSAFVDGVSKGNITPQRVVPKNPDSSSQLMDFADMVGYIEIYEPGLHHIEVRAYITKRIYYLTELYLDAPYFESWLSNVTANQDTVYIKYYLQPIFIMINAGESVNLKIGDIYQGQPTVQTEQWGSYFVEISVPLTDYLDKLQDRSVLTTIEVQGYARELQTYYWQPYYY